MKECRTSVTCSIKSLPMSHAHLRGLDLEHFDTQMIVLNIGWVLMGWLLAACPMWTRVCEGHTSLRTQLFLHVVQMENIGMHFESEYMPTTASCTQGWTGLLNLPGLSHEMFQQW